MIDSNCVCSLSVLSSAYACRFAQVSGGKWSTVPASGIGGLSLANLFPDAPPETSLQWVAPLRRWVELVIPFRTPRLSMRLAPALTGPWSEEVVGARPCPPSWRLRP